MRRVFVVLSSHAFPYARHCLETLLARSTEAIDLTLVTDDEDDRALYQPFLEGLDRGPHGWRVATKADCDALEAARFGDRPGLRALRAGHPCWRKITDPLLLSADHEEIIVLDPDLYFPNRFAFEPTPEGGVYVMRQGPNCLFPPAAVWRALDLGVPLANHVDIGVAQLRAGAIDLDWLDDLATRLRVQDFAGYMHIEAIIWAAAAMRFGGGHLNPGRWRCWERGYLKRLAAALGASGAWLLKREPLAEIKCIHVSGPSKWWVVDAVERGALRETGAAHESPSAMIPYVELTRGRYRVERFLKGTIGR